MHCLSYKRPVVAETTITATVIALRALAARSNLFAVVARS
jgi:hypothetical protein